ncbi:hypothetical protein ACQJBY_062895 [Aegilops geniculata]
MKTKPCHQEENTKVVAICRPLATGRKRNDIPHAYARKSNNLLYNHMLLFMMNKCVIIRSRLEKSDARITITVNRQKRASLEAIISRLSWTRCVANKRGHSNRGRWLIRRIHNRRTTSVVKKMIRGNHRGNLMDERGEVASGNEQGGEACGDVWVYNSITGRYARIGGQ